VLEAGESCGDLNYHYRRVGESLLGRSQQDALRDDDGQLGPRQLPLPRHITHRRSNPPSPCSGRGGGNSEIINAARAENALEASD
jgi:hypothetical protein